MSGFFFWSGVAIWAAIGCGVFFFLLLIARDAAKAFWFVCRVYRFGWLRGPSNSWLYSLRHPFTLWWYALLNAPEYMERHDGRGGRIYYPGRAQSGRFHA